MILTLLTIALAAAVTLAAGCRLIHMNVKTHKPGWLVVFVTFATGGAAVVLEATQGRSSWAPVLFMVGIALYLWLSRSTWRTGPPSFMEK